MSYTRYVYDRIHWLNKSESLTTPLGKTNLNRMDSAIYNIAENLDIAYNEMSTGKLDKSDADKLIVGMPSWNSNTGVLTINFYDGTQFQIDFNIEKIPVSFSMDSAGVITMTTADGTEWTADIGDVIPTYTYEDSDTIAFSDAKDGDYGHVISAEVKKNSITGEHLQPDYLADVTQQASNASSSAESASNYADNASIDAKMAQSYAIGESGIREEEATDNAKFYKEKAEQAAETAGDYLADLQSVQVTGVKGSNETTYRKGNVNITPENIGLSNVGNYKAVSTVASQGLTDTEKANARENISALATSGGTITGTTIFSKTQDLSGTADNRPALIVGGTPEQQHIEIDNNKIQAKNTNATTNSLYINNDGGNVILGKNMAILDEYEGHLGGGSQRCSYLDAKQIGSALFFDTRGGTKAPNAFYPILSQMTYIGWVYSLGVHENNIVLCGINPNRTENGYDWRITVDSTTGNVSFPDSVFATYFNGTATKATQDGNGNNIVNTYLPKSGGSITGRLNVSSAVQSWIHSFYGETSGVNIGAAYTNYISFRLGKSSGWGGGNDGIDMIFHDGFYSNLQPAVDGQSFLGGDNNRWNQIFSKNSTISTSDRRKKKDISYIGMDSGYDTYMSEDQLKKFIMGLMPCTYRLIDGESGRPHHGLISQDIEELMKEIGLSDHAGFIKSPKKRNIEAEKEIEVEEVDPETGEAKTVKKIVKELIQEEIPGEYIYSLRYEEFTADIIRFIQIQKIREDKLEERLEVSEMKNEEMEKRLDELEKLLIKQ